MGKIKSPTEMSGLLGERVSVLKKGSRVLVTNRPQLKERAPLTEKQIAFQQRFLEAANYAKQQTAREETRAMYEQGINARKKSAFMVALTDYIQAPKVVYIDAEEYDGSAGSSIFIKAIDDFMVEGVKVSITDSNGNVLEKGDAVPTPTLYLWKYTATVVNLSPKGTIIKAVAIDKPGNKTALEHTI